MTAPEPVEALVERLRGLLAKATEGPWRIDELGDIVAGPLNVAILYATTAEDRAILVAARNALPHLLDTIATLTADNARLREDMGRLQSKTIERCAKACDHQSDAFLSPEYSVGQPLSSFSERYACSCCATAIRAIAKEHNS